jgi:hypothetical protein
MRIVSRLRGVLEAPKKPGGHRALSRPPPEGPGSCRTELANGCLARLYRLGHGYDGSGHARRGESTNPRIDRLIRMEAEIG